MTKALFTRRTTVEPLDFDASTPPSELDRSLRQPLLVRLGLTGLDALVVVAAGMFCIALAPFLLVPRGSPRLALLLLALPAGAVSTVMRVARRDRAAVAALAALLWACVSALVSQDVAIALKGAIGRETSVLIMVSAVALWSLGAELTERGRAVLVEVLLAAFVMNTVVGVLQILVRPSSGTLALDAGRASGLTTHPVYFGALVAAGTSLVAFSWTARRTWISIALLVVFGVGLSVSGSRIALLAAIIVLVAAGWWAGWRHAGLTLATTSVGVGLGLVLTRAAASEPASSAALAAVGAISGRESAVDRLSSSGGGIGHRLELWSYGLQSVLDHPLLGTGMGNFRSAVQGRYSAEFTRLHARDDTAPWFDAHNVFVELAVAVGVVGLLLFVLFAALAARSARGPLAAASVAVGLTWLMQPAALATLPLVLLMLGAAGGLPSVFRGGSPTIARWGHAGLAVGVLLAGGFVFANARLEAAKQSADPQRVQSAAGLFWRDPVATDLVAQAWALDVARNPESVTSALEWRRRTVDFETSRPRWWEDLAEVQYYLDDKDAATESLERAIELQPWRIDSWRGMLILADEASDAVLERRALDAVCELQLAECQPQP